MPLVEYSCLKCNKTMKRYQPSKFCSRDCMNAYRVGENNPNYDNKWSKEQKQRQSERMKKEMESPERRYTAGSANRGKVFPEDIRKRMSESRKNKKRKLHTDESKKIIGEKSKRKFTEEYRLRDRKKREELGIWIPLDEKPGRDIYYQQSNWIARMFDVVDLELFKQHGIWHPSKNKNGLVRDHRYSRASGYRNSIFPEILRHPANCQLISHSENVRLRHYGDDVITLQQLFDSINNYPAIWMEQDICKEQIVRYLAGDRWQNPFKFND